MDAYSCLVSCGCGWGCVCICNFPPHHNLFAFLDVLDHGLNLLRELHHDDGFVANNFRCVTRFALVALSSCNEGFDAGMSDFESTAFEETKVMPWTSWRISRHVGANAFRPLPTWLADDFHAGSSVTFPDEHGRLFHFLLHDPLPVPVNDANICLKISFQMAHAVFER